MEFVVDISRLNKRGLETLGGMQRDLRFCEAFRKAMQGFRSVTMRLRLPQKDCSFSCRGQFDDASFVKVQG